MKYLVTGAAGFIGSHLCTELVRKGHDVWGLDDLSKGTLENLENLKNNPRFSMTVAGLSDKNTLFALMERTDIVYHLAAIVGVKRYVEDPVKVIEINVCQTARLLEFARRLHKKVVFTSTSEVYGKNSAIPYKEEADRVYGPSTTDRWCYAVSKSAAEHLCFGYGRRGLPVVIIRYFNVYGPKADSSEYGGVVTRFITQALAEEPLTIHGDGSQTRCFTFIDDIVKGTVAAGSHPQAEGRIINLGHRRETSILELAQTILKIAQIKGKLLFQPHKDFYGPHYEDIPRRVPDLSVAEQILHYQPNTTLEDGLQLTIQWYRRKMSR